MLKSALTIDYNYIKHLLYGIGFYM